MTRVSIALLILGFGAVVVNHAQAQGAPGIHQDNGGLNGSLSRSDIEKLNGDPKQRAEAAAAKVQSAKLLDKLKVACQMTHAQLVVAGTTRPPGGGKEVDTHVYEVACLDTFGYLLEVQGDAPPMAISCLAAEQARAADVEKGKSPTFFCKLPENRDVNAMVSWLIQKHTDTRCEVASLQSYGRSESTQSSYSEVKCKDGGGFLLRTPLPGSVAETTSMNCAQAAQQGIKCRLTDAGAVHVPTTLESLKSALGKNGVSCNVEQTRLIGQEDHRKRYVLEYLCAGQAVSQVAFIPLEDNANPYESLDCRAAAESGIQCELKPAH
jgi:hypothetical protein